MLTRQRFLKTLGAAAVAGGTSLVALPSQAWDFDFGGTLVKGSGKLASDKRSVSGFNEISLDISGKLEVIQGNTEGVTVEADDNLLPYIETAVESGRLRVRFNKHINVSTRNAIKITVNARTVEGLSVSGSGDVTANGLKTLKLRARVSGSGNIAIKALQVDDLMVAISGSGNFTADGAANSMEGSIAGSGDIRAATLSAKKVKLSIAGSGDAALWVRESLSVSVAGSGDVKYYGEGSLVKSSMAGSGSVRHMGTNPPAA
jgi:hypothetical protein